MRITLTARRCCASGLCVWIAPDIFGQRQDDGTGIVLDPTPQPSLWPLATEAANLCPGQAIDLITDG
jgi:ferredoxin